MPETDWISRVRQWAAGSTAAVKLGAAVVAALALLVLLGELAAWRRVREVEQRVVQVAPTRRFADLERVRVPAELAVPVVPGRVLERLARDYDRPGLATVTPAGEVVDAVAVRSIAAASTASMMRSRIWAADIVGPPICTA